MDKETSFGLALRLKATWNGRVFGNQGLDFGLVGWMAFAAGDFVERATMGQKGHARIGTLRGLLFCAVVPIDAVFALTIGAVKTQFLHGGRGGTLQCHAFVLIDVILSTRHFVVARIALLRDIYVSFYRSIRSVCLDEWTRIFVCAKVWVGWLVGW